MEKKVSIRTFLPVLLFLIPFLCYLSTMSISFDDRDSIHFALALEDYNIPKDQPHPPGFPVYIFLGKIVYALTENVLFSLTFISAFFGALSVLAFFYLVKRIFSEKIAYLSAIILSITPMFWLLSVQALSDMLAMFFLFITLNYLWKFSQEKKSRDIYLAGILMGIGFGVRLHLAFLLIPLLFYILKKNLKVKESLNVISTLIFSTLLWLTPLIASQGLDTYISENNSLLKACLKTENLLPFFETINPLEFIKKILDSAHYFFISGYGLNIFFLELTEAVFLIIFCFLLFNSLKEFSIRNKKEKWAVIIFTPYVLMILLSLPATNPRYFLPLIPLISIVLSKELIKLKKGEYLVITLFIIIFLLVQTIPSIMDVHTNLAPPEKLTIFIKEKYSPEDTIIINSGNLVRYATYFLGEYDQKRSLVGPKFYEGIPFENKTFKHEIYIFDNLKKDLPENSTLVISFERDPRIHVKHSAVYLYEVNK